MLPRRLSTVAVVFIQALALGCDTRVGVQAGIGGADGGATTTPTGPPNAQLPLVGVWSLILLNYGPSGSLTSASETRWHFDGAGNATRTSIATSFVSGIQEVVSTTGRWTATSTTMTITLTNPPSGTLVLPWRVERQAQGDVLVLGTLSFARRS